MPADAPLVCPSSPGQKLLIGDKPGGADQGKILILLLLLLRRNAPQAWQAWLHAMSTRSRTAEEAGMHKQENRVWDLFCHVGRILLSQDTHLPWPASESV